MRTKFFATTAAVAAVSLATLFAVAQPAQPPSNQPPAKRPPANQPPENQPPTNQPPGEAPLGRPAPESQAVEGNQALVHLLAGKLALANQCEIQLSQIATEKSSNDKVKEYAQKVIEDHQQLNRLLEQISPDIARMEGVPISTPGQTSAGGVDGATRGRSSRNPQDPSSQPGQANPPGQRRGAPGAEPNREPPATAAEGDRLEAKLLSIAVDAARIGGQMAREELNSHQGQDFDMAFLGMQLASHGMMVAELEAVRANDVGNDRFQQLVQMAESVSRQHMQQARQLSMELKDQPERRPAVGAATPQP
jgi:predicted outer membrane protein